MMKLSRSRCLFISVLIAAGFLYLAEATDGVDEFRRCYNTSVEMHCFDAQYDTQNRKWLTASYENARQRCNSLNSTLLIINDEGTNSIVQSYMTDLYNPIKIQYVWTDAYRINDYNKSYTWHWVNSKLPNLAAWEVGYNVFIYEGSYYTTALECRSDYGKPPLQFYLTAKRPQSSYSYLCEYSVSKCPSSSSNVLQFSDRCYVPFIASVSWYEARNRCLKDGGDLASFANVTSINFTSWLGSDTNVRFWIGLRFAWYIWKDIGLEAKFSKWNQNDDWNLLCLSTCSNCDQSLSLNWIPKDCNNKDNIYIVCHSITPLETTTLTTATTTTPVETTSTVVKTTQTENPQSSHPRSNSSTSEKNAESSPIALGVGVGVGIGVPVIVAIIVIVICVVRRQQSKKPEAATTRQGEETFPTDVHAGTGEGVDSSHYATIRSVSPPTPSENERTHETEYAILGFNNAADPKNNNGHIPLDVL